MAAFAAILLYLFDLQQNYNQINFLLINIKQSFKINSIGGYL